MIRIISFIEKTAGYLIGFLAILTFTEAALRYGFRNHIPDAFVIAKVLQGIAICWGIATATYADRHITVDIVYAGAGPRLRRLCDAVGYTLNLLFLAIFGCAISYKVFDIMAAGEKSTELGIPIWTGYTLAALGMLATVVMAAIRWWQVVVLPFRARDHG